MMRRRLVRLVGRLTVLALVGVGVAAVMPNSPLRNRPRSVSRPMPAISEPMSPELWHALNDTVSYKADAKRDRAVIKEAKHRIGAREDKKRKNRGKKVDAYVKSVGTPLGSPWCAAFVSHTVHTAFPDSQWLRSASCQHIYLWARHNDLLLDKPEAQSVVLFPGSDGAFHHIGFVTDYNFWTGTITTIEGNSNDEGSAEGTEVVKQERAVTNGMVFVKIV